MKTLPFLFVFAIAVVSADFLDHSKLDDLFQKNKLDEFVNGLKGISERTRDTLRKAGSLRKKMTEQGSKSVDKEVFNEFFNFIVKFEKIYDNETHIEHHFGKFKDSLSRIEDLQKKMPLTKFGVTMFADLTPEEFIQKHTGVKAAEDVQKLRSRVSKTLRPKRSVYPTSWDWRDHNGVTSVKNQAQCGSCYAFAAVAAIESHFKIANNWDLDLSEQSAISCTYNVSAYRYNQGCNGGWSDTVIQYASDYGLPTEQQYPYVSGKDAQVSYCQALPVAVKPNYVFTIPPNNEENMALAIYTWKPMVSYIDASPLQYYQGGVLDAAEPASGWVINHAVLTVGYGEENGVPYWIIKNSWGPAWGEAGFVRIRRGTNCLDISHYNYGVNNN
ncbi:unnamed protein product [Bursaphelenchus xylophilus]|uniref:(pine wood nematode) hypothetical protein n=1 Tax=Bursaphelenchus xylophilus TaxID=6326 RepID=A0A1I7S5L3_BURXY|nr:unnamed protein product [Bursaphelenchus xylophilus]CAG9124833.1 unnamed protein product [Bursaphelenchus xylophilus]